MKIKRLVNNGVEGYEIFDEHGNEYFIDELNEELAIKKFNEIKYHEANPPQPNYKELRKKEYPDIREQLDMIYWDKINGTNNWEKTITAVKTKFPIKV